MDQHMKRALLIRGPYDWETHDATMRRNRAQMDLIPEPEFPALGTDRISALLAEARHRRDSALVSGVGDGAGGLRTGRPLDNMIETPTGLRRHRAEQAGDCHGTGLGRLQAGRPTSATRG